jgi:4-hydroxythreonine-4-phosphate dehydrogenase
MKKIKIGITIGDFNGVGPEVIIKSLANVQMLDLCTPIIYGSSKVLSYHKNIVDNADFSFISTRSAENASARKINVVNCWDENVNINLGQITEEGGKFAYIALDRAIEDLKKNRIDALVTGPIHKKAMKLANFPFVGHTEYLTKEADQSDSLMILASEELKVGVVTGHIPLSQVSEKITKERLDKTLTLFLKSLEQDFAIQKPKIAVLGLNPHAGDEGLIGKEEEEIIRPAIIGHKKAGNLVMGPYSADGFFGQSMHRKFDGVLAMYHDQGLIPFKSFSFGMGVNVTAGLSFVRTSPDHGVAFDVAGKNIANAESMRQAIYTAIDIFKNRNNYLEMRENSLAKKPEPSEEVKE